MNLDGDLLETGNSVYDLRLDKYGTVSVILDNSFRVKFDGTEMSYGTGGTTTNGNKVIYWHRPAMHLPRKNRAEQNTLMQGVIDAVTAYRDA